MKNKFTERIEELRLENNLTQKELGEKLGYKKNSVCNWEARGKEPSFDVLL
ncbi:MAG: helix-turn-helix transcriptional regulator [Eubacteriales bacterium]|nr:helix-turn-helix transcriptional regulator [Eubacteriales bacterium]